MGVTQREQIRGLNQKKCSSHQIWNSLLQDTVDAKGLPVLYELFSAFLNVDFNRLWKASLNGNHGQSCESLPLASLITQHLSGRDSSNIYGKIMAAVSLEN